MPFLIRLKLFHKFLALVLPILILTILLTSFVLSRVNYGFFQKNIQRNYRSILRASAGEIHQYMEGARKNLQGLAWVLAAVKLDLWQQDMALLAFHQTAPQFMSLSLLTPEGDGVVSTESVPDHGGLQEAVRGALQGQSTMSGVMFGPDNIPYVQIAVPLVRLGKVSAVLCGELSMKSVWDVLEGIQIGETGSVCLINSSGRTIAHREMDRVVNAIVAVSPESLARLIEARDTPFEWVEERDTGKFYCLGYSIPVLNWVIVLSQENRETYAYVYRNIQWAALLTALLCLAAACTAWVPVKHFLAPIQNLHRQVLRISRGDLEQKVTVQSQDEIGDLSAAFNGMTDSLKTLIAREVETAKDLVHARNLATLGTAASNVTHEVGNLLTNMALMTRSLKREPLSPTARQSIHLLEVESERVKAFIWSFLQFAKKPEVRLSRMSLEVILHEVLAVHSAGAAERGIRYELSWPPDLPHIPVDPRLMYQVVTNLVKNSLDAMTGPGRIRMAGTVDGDWLQLVVEDSGPGIASDLLGQIFQPFFTTKGKKGTGLGLSICRTIVEAHRGTLSCRSEPGEGAAFVLRLPLR